MSRVKLSSLPKSTLQQSYPPRLPVARWQTFSACAFLLAVPFLCVGVFLLRLPSAQHNLLLGLVAGVGLSVIFGVLRKVPQEQLRGPQKRVTRPQRVTASRALFRCSTAILLVLLCPVLVVSSIDEDGLRPSDFTPMLAFLFGAPFWISGAVQNYRLYQKARREGPLVITPLSLPPDEMANLRNSKSVANLEHAVPESQIASADKVLTIVSASLADAAPVLATPGLEAQTQQIVTNNR